MLIASEQLFCDCNKFGNVLILMARGDSFKSSRASDHRMKVFLLLLLWLNELCIRSVVQSPKRVNVHKSNCSIKKIRLKLSSPAPPLFCGRKETREKVKSNLIRGWLMQSIDGLPARIRFLFCSLSPTIWRSTKRIRSRCRKKKTKKRFSADDSTCWGFVGREREPKMEFCGLTLSSGASHMLSFFSIHVCRRRRRRRRPTKRNPQQMIRNEITLSSPFFLFNSNSMIALFCPYVVFGRRRL